MKPHLLLSIIASACTILMMVNYAHADPKWSELSGDCRASNIYNSMSSTNDHVVNYYIEDDFANELKNCTPLSDSSMTEGMLRSKIQSAAELWNSQSRAAYLNYKGTLPIPGEVKPFASNNNTLCNSVSKPATIIVFVEGCLKNAQGICISNPGRIRALNGSACGQVSVIEILRNHLQLSR